MRSSSRSGWSSGTSQNVHASWVAVLPAGGRYSVGVSQVDRERSAKVADELPPEERAWLEEQLAIYRDLLAYLHDH
jgi:hypothetical protein